MSTKKKLAPRSRPGEMPQMLKTAKGRPYFYIKGQKYYLQGAYGSVEAEQDRLRKWAEYGAGHHVQPGRRKPVTVAMLVRAFLLWAKKKYVKHGRSTQSYERYCYTVEPLLELYSATPVSEFGSKALKAVRQKMLETGRLCRTIINERIGYIKYIFKWGVGEELVEPETKAKLYDVEGLEEGKTLAVDYDPIPPVEFDIVQKTLPHCAHPITADMVQVQMYGGMRPQDVCNMRLCDIDRSKDVWEYAP
ncbi:MAG TPA: hypothetical protein DEB39_15835 [Planctomycetaceae bacterium]|nr:hypothetical protein [Planctomycetaceae bacterium]